ncbi:tyrosine-type recombinase/integrase [Rhodococcus pyridinivorans]|uniref:tyrosine-type recombinase/integrase n=1 Tax=Rhodococcus pyridinivorans TaxID=103816 RepID=UPI000686A406|nr:tyrosine-type recombinase/integrase [Rhodococcus pyridinivorans]
MADAAGDRSALVLTLAYCGLRWGEAIGLRVSDLDLLRRRLVVSRNAVEVGSQVLVGTTKSAKDRSIPIPRFLVDDLAQRCEGKDRPDLVFPGTDGGFMRRPRQRSWFRTAAAATGIPEVTHMLCVTPRRRWRCRRALTSRPSDACSGTRRQP